VIPLAGVQGPRFKSAPATKRILGIPACVEGFLAFGCRPLYPVSNRVEYRLSSRAASSRQSMGAHSVRFVTFVTTSSGKLTTSFSLSRWVSRLTAPRSWPDPAHFRRAPNGPVVNATTPHKCMKGYQLTSRGTVSGKESSLQGAKSDYRPASPHNKHPTKRDTRYTTIRVPPIRAAYPLKLVLRVTHYCPLASLHPADHAHFRSAPRASPRPVFLGRQGRRLVHAMDSKPPMASVNSDAVTRFSIRAHESGVVMSQTLAVPSSLAVSIRVPSWLNETP
jgi:hypothetical protein